MSRNKDEFFAVLDDKTKLHPQREQEAVAILSNCTSEDLDSILIEPLMLEGRRLPLLKLVFIIGGKNNYFELLTKVIERIKAEKGLESEELIKFRDSAFQSVNTLPMVEFLLKEYPNNDLKTKAVNKKINYGLPILTVFEYLFEQCLDKKQKVNLLEANNHQLFRVSGLDNLALLWPQYPNDLKRGACESDEHGAFRHSAIYNALPKLQFLLKHCYSGDLKIDAFKAGNHKTFQGVSRNGFVPIIQFLWEQYPDDGLRIEALTVDNYGALDKAVVNGSYRTAKLLLTYAMELEGFDLKPMLDSLSQEQKNKVFEKEYKAQNKDITSEDIDAVIRGQKKETLQIAKDRLAYYEYIEGERAFCRDLLKGNEDSLFERSNEIFYKGKRGNALIAAYTIITGLQANDKIAGRPGLLKEIITTHILPKVFEIEAASATFFAEKIIERGSALIIANDIVNNFTIADPETSRPALPLELVLKIYYHKLLGVIIRTQFL